MVKIYNLVDARRAIRKLHLECERIEHLLLKSNTSGKSVQAVTPHLHTLSKLIQSAQINRDNAQSVRIALETELSETNNHVLRLKRNAKMIEDRSAKQISDIEDKLSHLSTKFDGKLQILLKDLDRRLARQFDTRYLVRQVVDREVGIIRIDKRQSDKTAFCVVLTEPLDLKEDAIESLGKNSYKIFFREIPADLSLENFHPFLSPSRAIQEITRTLEEDGF